VVLVGHSGPKTGAWWQDAQGLLDEWELNARVATALQYRLATLGWIAIPGTTGQKNPMGLRGKRAYVNSIAPDLCVEVHFNIASKQGARGVRWPGCSGSPFLRGNIPIEGVRGVSVLYNEHNSDTLNLALRIVGGVAAASGLPVAYGGDGLDPRPTRRWQRGYNYLIARTHCPTVLLEVAFLTNPEDRTEIREDWAFYDKVGRGGGDAIDEWWLVRQEDGT
jgi:N-acetylmuramoyl-L-alanine amidase